MNNFKNYILLWTLLPLMILFISASYYRFIVKNDYLVSYEAPCDENLNSCFIGCTDESCAETYPYLLIERDANELNKICGEDVSNCPLADSCSLVNDKSCRVTYCEVTTDTKCTVTKNKSDETNTI